MDETPYTSIFLISVLVNVFVTLKSTGLWTKVIAKLGLATPDNNISATEDTLAEQKEAATNELENKKHLQLLKRYLVVYLLATSSDWLQGPYVYALYSDYGYSQHEIAILFVAGFGSSMIFGSFVGGMADWGGRRTFVILYAVLYALSCVTKHFNSFGVLMLGRLLGGIATSLLFSVFEAWFIRAHNDAKLKQYIGKSFSWASFGNSTVAIIAGLIANNAASAFPMTKVFEQTNLHYGGYLNPFDIAMISLLACGACAVSMWEENYGNDNNNNSNDNNNNIDGDSSQNKGNSGKWYDGLQQAWGMAMRNSEIMLCGIISSLFEGSMYIFVFMWTPALTGGNPDIQLPFGLIFSTFMVCCMIGSSCFGLFMEEKVKVEQLGILVFGLASASMFIVVLAPNQTLSLIAMNLFEITVGLYWPTMGTMKGSIVPESTRAAIYNLYRIPLNFIVLFSLLTDIPPQTSFLLCGLMLGTATVLQYILAQKRLVSTGMLSKSLDSTTINNEIEEEKEMMVGLVSKSSDGPKADTV